MGEQLLLRRMDPQQHQSLRVRHSPEGLEDGGGIRRQWHGDPGNVQACRRVLYSDVQAQGVLALVHGRRNGRDGIHGSRIEHERPRLGVPAVKTPRPRRRVNSTTRKPSTTSESQDASPTPGAKVGSWALTPIPLRCKIGCMRNSSERATKQNQTKTVALMLAAGKRRSYCCAQQE